MLFFFLLFPSLLNWITVPVNTAADNPLTVDGITLQYYLYPDSIEIQLSAPTKGWVAVGFHSENQLVGSDLLMFSVQHGQIVYQDQYIRNWNDHPQDSILGGRNNISIIGYLEDEGSTSVKFKIPINSGDAYDKAHQFDQDFWLLLAYSVEDDFGHHSITRKQIRYRFTSL